MNDFFLPLQTTQKCGYCGKTFPNAKYLNEHAKIHTTEKSLACKYCDKEFRFARDLARHTRVHTGEKPYQ